MNAEQLQLQLVTFNSAATLVALLTSLRQQTVRFRLVVIDNNSQDDSVALVEKNFPEAIIIRNQKNLGFCAGHNQGIAIARNAEYIGFVNPDITLTNNAVEQCVAAFQCDPRIASVTGKLLRTGAESGILDSTGLQPTPYREFLNRGEGERDQGQYDQPGPVFGSSGAFVIFRAAALADVAYNGKVLDESLFMYKDDVDIAWSLLERGWTHWYQPTAVGYHTRSLRAATTRTLSSMRGYKSAFANRLSYRNHFLVLLKHECFRGWLFPWPRMVLYELAKLVYIPFREPGSLSSVSDIVRLAPAMKRFHRWMAARRTVSCLTLHQRYFS